MNERDNRVVENGVARRILAGVKAVAGPVGSTMGPGGRTVLVERKFGRPTVTKDGVTVAKEVFLSDSTANMAAQLVKEAAVKVNETSGDGTSQTCVLTEALLEAALARAEGVGSTVAVKELGEMLGAAEKFLKGRAVKFERSMAAHVASISANSADIGQLVAVAMGDDPSAAVAVEDWTGPSVKVEQADGFRWKSGLAAPIFVTDPHGLKSSATDALVAVWDGKMTRESEIVPILETAHAMGRPLVVFAEGFDGPAMAVMAANHVRGALKVVPVKSMGFGRQRTENLSDLAALVGARLMGENGLTASDFSREWFGRVKSITVDRDEAMVVLDGDRPSEAVDREAGVREQLKLAESKFDREVLGERLERLSGRVSVIKVGGATETDRQETRDRVEDAVQALAAAVDGVLPGGGNALAAFAAYEMTASNGTPYAEALLAPRRKILENAGIVDQATDGTRWGHDFDASTGDVVDLLAAGIVDPLNVTLAALRAATATASLLARTDWTLTYVEKKGSRDVLPPDHLGNSL